MVNNSESTTSKHGFFSKTGHRRVRSVSDLASLLLDEKKSNQIFYQAALSQLIAFIKRADALKEDDYYSKREGLARRVLIYGTKLYALHDKITLDSIAKKQLAHTLYFCGLLAGEKTSQWKHFLDESDHDSNIELRNFIRSSTANSNWYRLYAVRVKRVFVALLPMVKSLFYQRIIHSIQKIDPVLSYVAWMFYVPRLLANLFYLFQHVVPGPWMSAEEQEIDINKRTSTYLGWLWFELLNDGVWCFVGLMCCFVLNAPHALMLTVALYFFDVLMSFANFKFKTLHHQDLRKALDQKLEILEKLVAGFHENEEFQDADFFMAEPSVLKEHIEYVNAWLAYEKQKLNLSVLVTSSLAIAMTLGLMPTLFSLGAVLTVLCPLVSASAVVAVCTMQYLQTYNIESQCPNTNIFVLQDLELKLASKTIESKEPEKVVHFEDMPNNLSTTRSQSWFPDKEEALKEKPRLKRVSSHPDYLSNPNKLWQAAEEEEGVWLEPVSPSR